MVPITVRPARSGEPAASAGTIRIHSSYNPGQEAERYLNEHLSKIRDHATVLVIGAGLGYLDRKLRELRPENAIIAIHLNTRLFESRIDHDRPIPGIDRWHPGAPGDIDSFLSRVIPETSVGGLYVLTWPPSARAFPQAAKEVEEALGRIVRHHTGNLSATAAFGRLWLRNIFRNYLSTDFIANPICSGDPVVLAASGPGLETSLDQLQRYRRHFRLWALPSSLAALAEANLEPDLVVATDPGFWARLHSRYLPGNCPVAMPLTAAPLPEDAGPPMPLDQGTQGELEVSRTESWQAIRLPAMGTVAATAIELWKRISTGRLIIAGLDLCWHDLRAHVRPHAFDGWLSTLESRLNPKQEIHWERARRMAPGRIGDKRIGPSLRTYADWFTAHVRDARIARFDSGGMAIPGVQIFDQQDLGRMEKVSGDPYRTKTRPVKSRPEERRQRVRSILKDWQKRLILPTEQMDSGIMDLMYMLDPGGLHEMKRVPESRRREIEENHRQRVTGIVNDLASLYDR